MRLNSLALPFLFFLSYKECFSHAKNILGIPRAIEGKYY